MNVTLIGMPGSGKSYVGKILAERVGYVFLEIDSIIETEYGLALQSVVDKLGVEDFLDVEAARIVAHCKGKDHAVISPGGSVVYRERAMEFLKSISTVVYLRVPIEILQARIGSKARGIANPRGKPFDALYDERVSLYEKWADVSVDGSADADSVVSDILSVVPIKPLV